MSFALLGLLVLSAAAQAAPAAQATAPGDVFPYKVHESKLDNGLQVVVIPYDSPGTVAYFSVVRTGSRDEVEAGHSGFAHFFEHMMFRGTDKYSTDAYNDILKRMGADSNAFTSDDQTVYHMVGPSSALETMFDMESDRFKGLKYSEEGFRTESQAVLGEYNKSASSPFQPLFEKLRDLAFQSHTYKHTTIGFIADVKAMPGYYEYSKQFFSRFYRPENVTLLIVGDVQPDKALALAKKYYGDWKTGYQKPAIQAEPVQTQTQTGQIDWPNPIHPHLMIGYHTPAFSTASPDSAALDLIDQLLFSESAPLYQDLVVQKQWVDFVQGSPDPHRDPYLYTIIARVKSDELVPKVQDAINQALAQLQSQPVDQQRLERIKSHLRYGFALSLDTPGAVANQAAAAIAVAGNVSSINDLFREYQKVTPADIQRVAKQIFTPKNETIVTLAHAGGDKPATGTQGGASHD